ncbi:MAG TPA: hypothetical protein VNN79_10445 [Actinomycetota bacterium]|jgi:hypothetical protein|nr:hypothetical protein [Actinomycetota bacterium]
MEREPGTQPANEAAGRTGRPDPPATLPAHVWISRLGTAESELEGTLALTPTELRFDHRRGSRHERVPLTAIRKVKRPVGSPLLYVEYDDRDGELVRLAFFFAQPPPIDTDVSKMRARRKRSDNAGFMWQQSGNVAFVVKAWRDAIRTAVKRAKSATS